MSFSFEKNDSVESLPAADIVAPVERKDILTSERSLPVKIPKQEANNFIVEVSASDLRRIRDKLAPYSKKTFSWSEILIGLGGASLGAILGALASQVPMSSFRGFIFYVVCPMVLVGTIVRYFSESKSSQINTVNLANELLSELPDPDEAIEKERSK